MAEKQQSPSWNLYESHLGPVHEGFPFNEGFPAGGPLGTAERSYELLICNGERVQARPDYSRQYAAEGLQWKTTKGVTLEKHVVAAWKER